MILSKLRHQGSLWGVAGIAVSFFGGYFLFYFLKNRLRRRALLNSQWEEVGVVSQLLIHPIKSARPVAVTEATASKDGLVKGDFADRSFIICTEEGEMVTGRQCNKLTTLATDFSGNILALKSLEGAEISLDLKEIQKKRRLTTFSMRGDAVQGVDCGDEVADWLSRQLYEGRTKVRLLFKSSVSWQRKKRSFSFNFPKFGENDSTLYNDSCSYMIMSEASMRDLNSKLPTKVDFRFFRPCITIDGVGLEAFEEDLWMYVKIGDNVVLHEAKPREICALTLIDPIDASKKHEHFDTLKTYRCVVEPESLSRLWSGRPIFGVHCGLDLEGDLRVGDRVSVLRRTTPYWKAGPYQTH